MGVLRDDRAASIAERLEPGSGTGTARDVGHDSSGSFPAESLQEGSGNPGRQDICIETVIPKAKMRGLPSE